MKRYYALWLYALTLIALSVASLQGWLEERRLLVEARGRAASLAMSVEDSVITHYATKNFDRIAKLVDRLRDSSRTVGMAICPRGIGFPRAERGLEPDIDWRAICRDARVERSVLNGRDADWVLTNGDRKLQFHTHPFESASAGQAEQTIVLAQDLGPLRARWIETFARAFAMTWLGGLMVLLLVATQARSVFVGNLKTFRHALRSLIAGRAPMLSHATDGLTAELQPVSRELDRLAAKVLALRSRDHRDKGAAEQKSWLARLRESMGDRSLVVIANREPYIHQKLSSDRVEVIRPASGLVTALEPILRQCGGLWVAHGSGSADFDVTDADDQVSVPPGQAKYRLKRVRLTKEEEEGYYYGFANEGLWPLCHLAHNRPTFRLNDWNHYQAVNQKFCDSIPTESLGEKSLILVQDYHFALLPRMIKERVQRENPAVSRRGLPKVGIFWHIPWPNPEAFSICPWSKELLRGMLGADVIGFHTQYHCNNFLETCNRLLEARIDYERFSVTMDSHETLIQPFPIGIDTSPVRFVSDSEVSELKARYGIVAEKVAVGVDRLDYTKGIIERVESVGRFLEKHPEWVGRFSLAQMGAPSRTHIPAYRALGELLETTVNRINAQFSGQGPDGYQPIVFVPTHHEWDAIQYFYQLGDVCMVTSLHDGMNLVAKEYVWCQRPERGSLILSKFTGASRELTDAFVVNPYSIEEMADALNSALTMPGEERVRRMLSMRERVGANSAYHWASNLIRAVITSGPATGLGAESGTRPGLTLAPSPRTSDSGRARTS